MQAAKNEARALPADAEWLLADGRGGYACGTVGDLVRRRYHGLWVARLGDSAKRHMLVAGVDERVAVGDEVLSLLHAHWSGQPGPVAPPVDYAFAPHPFPTFAFRHGAFALERAVQLRPVTEEHGPALLMRWRNLGAAPLRLAVRPLLGWGDVDHLMVAHADFDGAVASRGASWGFRPDDTLPTLWLTTEAVAAFRSEPDWYRGFVYDVDRDRGYDSEGDRWSPGSLELHLPPGGMATVSFALEDPCLDPAAVWDDLAALAEAGCLATGDGLAGRLEATADDFLYRAAGGRLGVLAGFPWFGEWGRDVFLALPGLSLARGRVDLCEEVLSGALPFLRDGLLPNIYAGSVEDSHYGSCDAALWFALCVQRYCDAGGDSARVQDEYLPALVSIVDSYVEGTELGLAVDDDGLLRAGGPDLNATWMDAATSAGPVTPRQGLPVEIQALWHSLLAFLVERGERRFDEHARACGQAFLARFWLDDGDRLADCVHEGVADLSVRPNMLVAAALQRSPLSRSQRAGVVAVADAQLVTPRGLRTLSPEDDAYRGRYGGSIVDRDSAYHQGTVWPWLAGFYVEASLRAATGSTRPAVRRRLRSWLGGMEPELDRAGLEHVSEVFDGDAPQRPAGTFAQAWNTGELLRAWALLGDES